jgi:tetratricopeptide (TPR) repeat protein
MTVRQAGAAFVGLMLGAVLAEAQIAGKFVDQKCGLRPGHGSVSSGVNFLRRGVETRFEDERQKQLTEAERVLVKAVTTDGQQENPAAWYYLGRYYLIKNDAAGADSAMARAERLRADCADDIDTWRQFLWVPVFNAGVAAWQGGDTDSAIASFTRATAINRKDPNGLIYLAILHANKEQVDSAIKYFKRGIDAAGNDTAFADDKRQAIFNLARMYHRSQRWDEATVTYRGYLAAYGADAEATAALASVYHATGKRDSATLLYHQVLDRSDSADFLDLFQAGVAIFRGAPSFPDTATAGARCRAGVQGTPAVKRQRCRPVIDSLQRDYEAESRKTYALAARAFEAVLAKNPFYRDALYNLTNTYYQTRDTAKILPVARRLIAVDPMNRTSNLFLAQAYQMQAKGDSALYYLQVSDSILPFEVNVTELKLNDSSTAVGGLITNFHQRPSPPLILAFEFLNAKGEVVGSKDYEVPTVGPEGNHAFTVEVQSAGVAAYRYRQKS